MSYRTPGYGGGGGGGGGMSGGGVKSFVFGALVGSAVGGGAVYKFTSSSSSSSSSPGPLETAPSRKLEKKRGEEEDVEEDATTTTHPAMRMGWPMSTESLLRVHSGYVASFDARTRNPRWVLEILNEKTCKGPGDRKRSNFVEDEAFGERFRNKLFDFRGSGYDRGHLAAAAGHKDSQLAMDETFKLCNISPQVGVGFNRDYWARLERFTRELAMNTGGDVLVATGPLFLPTRTSSSSSSSGVPGSVPGTLQTYSPVATTTTTTMTMTGDGGKKTNDDATATRPTTTEYEMRYPLLGTAPELTSVPTHFFKVILAVPPPPPSSSSSPSSPVAAAAFVLPNAPIHPDTPMDRFVVPLMDLEAASGLSFFRQAGGALGGSETRAKYEAAERTFLEFREQNNSNNNTRSLPTHSQPRRRAIDVGGDVGSAAADGGSRDGSSKEAAKRLGSTLHVCQLTSCTLPVDEYAKGGAKYKYINKGDGSGSGSGGRRR